MFGSFLATLERTCRAPGNYYCASLLRTYVGFHCLYLLATWLPSWEIIYRACLILEPGILASHEGLFPPLFKLVLLNSLSFPLLWGAFAAMLMFGICCRLCSFVLFILSKLMFVYICPYITDGGDFWLSFLLFYLIFLKSDHSFRLFTRNPSSSGSGPHGPLNLEYFFHNLGTWMIRLHMCVGYFFCAIYKIHSEAWFNGVGIYYSLSLSEFSGTSINKYLVQSDYFLFLANYGTIVVELLFPVFALMRKAKFIWLPLTGMMHVGIYFLMMIHSFAALFLATYVLFLDDTELGRIKSIVARIFSGTLGFANREAVA